MATDVKNDASLGASLVSYWRLEEASGTRYDAVTGTGNDLTDVNTVGQATGKQGNCADFESGNQEGLKITDASQTGLDPSGDFSIACWIKPESIAVNGMIVSKADATSTNRPYYLYTSSNGVVQVYLNNTSYIGSASSTITTGTWYHVVFTYDYVTSGTSKMNLYVDGSSAATEITNAVGPPVNSSADFYIGHWAKTGDVKPFDGLVDEVGFWSKALTASDASALYNSGTGIPYEAAASTATPFAQAIII